MHRQCRLEMRDAAQHNDTAFSNGLLKSNGVFLLPRAIIQTMKMPSGTKIPEGIYCFADRF